MNRCDAGLTTVVVKPKTCLPRIFRTVVATACAASIGALAIPSHALATPKTRRATKAPRARTAAPKRATFTHVLPVSAREGANLFSAIFFDVGPDAGKLNEFHKGNAEALRINRAARVKRTPASMEALARYLDNKDEGESATAARSAGAAISGVKTGTLAPATARRLLLDGIHKHDPTFFRRFAAAVNSGNVAKIDAALVESGHVTLAAVEALQGEHALGNVTMGPQGAVAIVAVLVIVVVIAVAVTAVAIDKDTPDQDATGEGCNGGGDCDEMVIPQSVLQRTELASLIAKRFARAR